MAPLVQLMKRWPRAVIRRIFGLVPPELLEESVTQRQAETRRNKLSIMGEGNQSHRPGHRPTTTTGIRAGPLPWLRICRGEEVDHQLWNKLAHFGAAGFVGARRQGCTRRLRSTTTGVPVSVQSRRRE